GSGAQLSTAALKTGAFLILVMACFLLGGPAHRAAQQSIISSLALPSGWPLIVAIMLGLQGVIYTVDGWDGVIYFGEEVRNPCGTPVMALFLSTVVGVLFLLTGTFERVSAMLSFFFVANYALSYASLFVLRKREPEMVRPYRAWGYPWTPGIALVASVLFLAGSILTDQKNAPWALATLVLSYPVFRVLKWVTHRAQASAGANT